MDRDGVIFTQCLNPAKSFGGLLEEPKIERSQRAPGVRYPKRTRQLPRRSAKLLRRTIRNPRDRLRPGAPRPDYGSDGAREPEGKVRAPQDPPALPRSSRSPTLNDVSGQIGTERVRPQRQNPQPAIVRLADRRPQVGKRFTGTREIDSTEGVERSHGGLKGLR